MGNGTRERNSGVRRPEAALDILRALGAKVGGLGLGARGAQGELGYPCQRRQQRLAIYAHTLKVFHQTSADDLGPDRIALRAEVEPIEHVVIRVGFAAFSEQ